MKRRTIRLPSVRERVALDAARRGWPVFLLAPGGKKPQRGSRGFKDATTDRTAVRKSFARSRDANYGIRTGGASGLLVVDIDPRNGGDQSIAALAAEHGELPETVTVETAGGGLHLYFRHPADEVGSRANALGAGVDVKGEGGYVVGPGSRNWAGAWQYAEGCAPWECDLAEAPPWLLDRVQRKRERKRKPTDGQVPEGSRHDWLVTVAVAMYRGGMRGDAIRDALVVYRDRQCEAGGRQIADDEIDRIIEWLADQERPGAYAWKRASVRDMVTASPREIEWVVRGLIARDELWVLTADPKAGKTWALYAIAIGVALGLPVLGKYGCAGPARVLLVDEEMGEANIARRIQRLARGLELTDEQLDTLDRYLDIRPQQGLSLGDEDCYAAYRHTLLAGDYDLVIFDSLVALQQGEENSATARREFYNRAIAPFKTGRAFAVAAHPPIRTRDNGGLRRRPRGSGDILAQCDRASWLDRITEDDDTLCVALEEIVAREAGGLAREVIRIAGRPGEPITVTADATPAELVLGKIANCKRDILARLREATDGRLYQPEVRRALTSDGRYSRDSYQQAVSALRRAGAVEIVTISESGKRGKWLRLKDENHA